MPDVGRGLWRCWEQYVAHAQRALAISANATYHIRFESFLIEPGGPVELAKFCGINADPKAIEQAISRVGMNTKRANAFACGPPKIERFTIGFAARELDGASRIRRMSIRRTSRSLSSTGTVRKIANCLKSLRDGKGELQIQIIVVDNASTDDSGRDHAQEFPEIALIRNTDKPWLRRRE